MQDKPLISLMVAPPSSSDSVRAGLRYHKSACRRRVKDLGNLTNVNGLVWGCHQVAATCYSSLNTCIPPWGEAYLQELLMLLKLIQTKTEETETIYLSGIHLSGLRWFTVKRWNNIIKHNITVIHLTPMLESMNQVANIVHSISNGVVNTFTGAYINGCLA